MFPVPFNAFSDESIGIVYIEEAKVKQRHNALLLDVREYSNWRIWHLPGSINIPLEEIAVRCQEFERTREIIVVCRNGERSKTAVSRLKEMGFSKISYIKNGMSSTLGQTDRRKSVSEHCDAAFK